MPLLPDLRQRLTEILATKSSPNRNRSRLATRALGPRAATRRSSGTAALARGPVGPSRPAAPSVLAGARPRSALKRARGGRESAPVASTGSLTTAQKRETRQKRTLASLPGDLSSVSRQLKIKRRQSQRRLTELSRLSAAGSITADAFKRESASIRNTLNTATKNIKP